MEWSVWDGDERIPCESVDEALARAIAGAGTVQWRTPWTPITKTGEFLASALVANGVSLDDLIGWVTDGSALTHEYELMTGVRDELDLGVERLSPVEWAVLPALVDRLGEDDRMMALKLLERVPA